MKKLILFAAILFAGVSIAKADGSKHIAQGVKDNNDAKLTVTLNSVQAILINEPNIHLEYTSIENYKNGVSSEVTDHLNVYSTGGYSVSVKYGNATDSYTTADVDDKTDTSATLFGSIKVSVGATDGIITTPQSLTTGGETIIESNGGTLDTNYNVKYEGAISNAYAQYIQKGTQRVYTADVTYTIAPK